MKRLLLLAAVLAFMAAALRAAEASRAPAALFRPNDRILFQGDSITDGARGRSEDPNHILGHGYVFIIAARHGAAFPARNLTFLNRGVSGNRVSELAQRWETDTVAPKPDVVSVLIGVNDILLGFRDGAPVSVDDYAHAYDRLLAATVAARPKVRLVLCEPFILPGRHTQSRWPEWQATVHAMQRAVAQLAEKYHAPVVRFQKMFDDACQRAPVEHWIWDGIHPTYSGHQLMADEWEATFRACYGDPSGEPTVTP